MLKNKLSKPLMALAALASIGAGFGVAALASANTASSTTPNSYMGMRAHKPLIGGKVTAISGTTITIESFGGPKKTDSTQTYTIDASSAQIISGLENGAEKTGSLADITVGNMIGVEGTLSGNQVSATKIMTGMPGRGMFMNHRGHEGTLGTVQTINGTTITVAGKDGTVYTVNAADAKVHKMVTTSVSDLTVGESIGIRGERSGSTITAKDIMSGIPDQAFGNGQDR